MSDVSERVQVLSSWEERVSRLEELAEKLLGFGEPYPFSARIFAHLAF